MADSKMMSQMSIKPGFIAALDQSSGSTPGVVGAYGIPGGAHNGDEESSRWRPPSSRRSLSNGLASIQGVFDNRNS